MAKNLAAAQIEKKLAEDEELTAAIPDSFQLILDNLGQGKPITNECKALFLDSQYLGMNLFLFEKFENLILLYLDDNAKCQILDCLQDLYLKGKCGGHGKRVFDAFIIITNSISDQETRKRYAALSTHLLEENPCNADLRDRVERLLARDIPGFRF